MRKLPGKAVTWREHTAPSTASSGQRHGGKSRTRSMRRQGEITGSFTGTCSRSWKTAWERYSQTEPQGVGKLLQVQGKAGVRTDRRLKLDVRKSFLCRRVGQPQMGVQSGWRSPSLEAFKVWAAKATARLAGCWRRLCLSGPQRSLQANPGHLSAKPSAVLDPNHDRGDEGSDCSLHPPQLDRGHSQHTALEETSQPGSVMSLIQEAGGLQPPKQTLFFWDPPACHRPWTSATAKSPTPCALPPHTPTTNTPARAAVARLFTERDGSPLQESSRFTDLPPVYCREETHRSGKDTRVSREHGESSSLQPILAKAPFDFHPPRPLWSHGAKRVECFWQLPNQVRKSPSKSSGILSHRRKNMKTGHLAHSLPARHMLQGHQLSPAPTKHTAQAGGAKGCSAVIWAAPMARKQGGVFLGEGQEKCTHRCVSQERHRETWP